MLKIENVSFNIAGQLLFTNANAFISEGSKVGIVGRNGSGKSTLFKLIQNRSTLDSGEIKIRKGISIGEISQEIPNGYQTVIETILFADKERQALLASKEKAVCADEIGRIQERLIDIEAYSAEARASKILYGLGFGGEDQKRTCNEFSGGWQMRISLAKILFCSPDLLLLDEPTNFLDLEGSIWLENFLKNYQKTFLLISHDRTILTNSVTSILHVSKKKLTSFVGNYDKFVKSYNQTLVHESAIYKKSENKKKKINKFVERFRAKASKAKQAQSRLKALEKMVSSLPTSMKSIPSFVIPEVESLSPPILLLNDVKVGYGSKVILDNLNLRIDPDDRIAIIGKNGGGKSTFAKLLAGKLKAMSGVITKNNNLRVGYFSQHVIDELNLDQTPLTHIEKLLPKKPKTKLNSLLAAGGLLNDQVNTPVGNLSGGQKARLALILLTVKAPHLMILDEPTNHLDIESRERLAASLNNFEGGVLIISHDAHIINLIATELWLVKDNTVNPFNGSLEEYEKVLKLEPKHKNRPKKNHLKVSGQRSEERSKGSASNLQKQIQKAEERLQKLGHLRQFLENKLADPQTYTKSNNQIIEKLNIQYKELSEAIIRAENIWIELSEKVD